MKQRNPDLHDIFLAHNNLDKPALQVAADELKLRGLWPQINDTVWSLARNSMALTAFS
jgi:hypothetical protein